MFLGGKYLLAVVGFFVLGVPVSACPPPLDSCVEFFNQRLLMAVLLSAAQQSCIFDGCTAACCTSTYILREDGEGGCGKSFAGEVLVFF